MRAFLIFLNLLLAGALVWAVAGWLEPETQPVSARTSRTRPQETTTATAAPGRVLTPEQAVELITRNNPFATSRAPAAGVWGGRAGNVSLTLVGLYDLGGAQGAVILQKSQARRPGPPGMPRPPEGNSQQNHAPQQFVRVGETLSNGYTLQEIGADYAVLVRNGSRLDLKLQEASKNAPATVAQRQNNQRNQRRNAFQQFQEMQMRQQMGIMHMMRQMMQMQNANMRNNRPGGNLRGGQVVGGATRRTQATSANFSFGN